MKPSERFKERKASSEQEEVMKKWLGDSADDVLGQLERKEDEGAITKLQRSLLASAIAMLSHAESNALASKASRGIYQYNALISQVRELIGDMQANQDSVLIAERINESVNLHLRAYVQCIVDENHSLKRSLKEIVSADEYRKVSKLIDDNSRTFAQLLKETGNAIKASVTERIVD